MRKLIRIAVMLLAVCVTLSCSGVRSASGPSGPVIPSSGSASSIASGRNTIAAPIASDMGSGATGDANSNADSLVNQLNAVPKKDRPMQFIKEAAVSGTVEVQLSELALKRSENTYVKAFASTMVKDHGAANTELKALAASKDIGIDSLLKSKAMDIGQKTTQLTAASGQDFENLYIQTMIKDHGQAVRLFEEGAKSSDPEVKAYAKKYLPLLKMHLKNVSALNSK